MSAVRIERWGFIIALLMLAISIAWMQPGVSLSLLGGAAISVGSFMLMRLIVEGALKRRGITRAALVAAAFLKLAILGVVLWWVVTRLAIRPFPFMIGLSTIVLAVGVESQYARWKRTGEDVT